MRIAATAVLIFFSLAGCSETPADVAERSAPAPGQVSVTGTSLRPTGPTDALLTLTLVSSDTNALTGVKVSAGKDTTTAQMFEGFAPVSIPSGRPSSRPPVPEPVDPTADIELPAGESLAVGPGQGPGVLVEDLRLRGHSAVTAVLQFRHGPDLSVEVPVTR